MTALGQYRKTIAAILGAVGTWGITAADGGISAAEWFGLCAALATALGVYAVTNSPDPADPGEKGQATVLELLLIVLLVVVLFNLFGWHSR